MPSSAVSPSAPREKTDPEFEKHLTALGLVSAEEYQAWCARRGFSTRLDKHWRDRGQERYHAARGAVAARRARKKHERRNPRAVLRGIFDGGIQESDVTQPHLALICGLVGQLTEKETRQGFLELLLHAERGGGLLSTQPAIRLLGARRGSTFIEGLLALARHRPRWIRSLDAWSERSRRPRRRFGSLARHLLARYPVPVFMDAAWLQGMTAEAARQQEWFVALGSGASVRRLDLPIPLTRRMAHHFLKAPPDFSIEAALRWGQVVGMGGGPRLARAILGSRLGLAVGSWDEVIRWGEALGVRRLDVARRLLDPRAGAAAEHQEFWTSVIRWLVQNPTFDPAQVGPLIDFIHRQKFEPQFIEIAPGEWEFRPRDPNFSLKGRTAASMLRQMREWHGELRKQPARSQLTWPASGIGGFAWTEGVAGSADERRWTIIELLSRSALFEEGQAMRHCVASYDNMCVLAGSSIWSLGVERNADRRRRVLTIEVAIRSKKIRQIRGRANRRPKEAELTHVRRWAAQEGLLLNTFG